MKTVKNEVTVASSNIYSEIVRCIDCINYQEQYRDYMKQGWYFCGETETFWPPDGYCCFGEKLITDLEETS